MDNDADSIMTPHGGEDQDEMMQDSRAAFGYYRPDIKQIPDPLTYKEAVKKYRQHADPNMGEHIKNLKKLGLGYTIAKANKTVISTRQRSHGQELNRYLGVNP